MLLKPLKLLTIISLMGSVPFGALPAKAEEHIVIILGAAYFPQETAVTEGDVVRFVNVSGAEHTVMHASGQWATMAIGDGEEILVTIDADMTGPFYGEAKKRITGRLELIRTAEDPNG